MVSLNLAVTLLFLICEMSQLPCVGSSSSTVVISILCYPEKDQVLLSREQKNALKIHHRPSGIAFVQKLQYMPCRIVSLTTSHSRVSIPNIVRHTYCNKNSKKIFYPRTLCQRTSFFHSASRSPSFRMNLPQSTHEQH